MPISKIDTAPIYTYIHKDGRTGSDSKGSWYAIKKALGNDEAMKIIDESDSIQWNFVGTIKKANLIFKGDVIGTFLKG